MGLLLHTYSLIAAMNSHVNGEGRVSVDECPFHGCVCALKNAPCGGGVRVHSSLPPHTHNINCIVAAWLRSENGCKSSAQEVHINCENLYGYFFENSCLPYYEYTTCPMLLLGQVASWSWSKMLGYCARFPFHILYILLLTHISYYCKPGQSESLFFGFGQDVAICSWQARSY